MNTPTTATRTINVFLTLKIQCGEYEFYSMGTHKVDEGKLKEIEIDIESSDEADVDQYNEEQQEESQKWTPEKWAESYAANFYSGTPYISNGAYFFNGGEVAVSVYGVQEVSDTEYETLSKYVR